MANLLEFSKIRQMPNNGSRVDLMPLYFPEDRRWQLALFIESGGEAYTYVNKGDFHLALRSNFFNFNARYGTISIFVSYFLRRKLMGCFRNLIGW